MKNATRQVPEGKMVYRTEVALRELSLAPTGFGQYSDAGVLSVRDETGMDADDDPLRQIAAIDAVIDAALKCLDPSDDDYNPAQAADLLVGAESSVDDLMEMFGIVDPDDEMVMPVRMKLVTARAISVRHRRTRSILASHPLPRI